MREFKGELVRHTISDYAVVDVETTGLNFDYDEIIQIAALRVRNNAIVDSYSTYVKPYNSFGNNILSAFITNLTGITDDMLSSAPYLDEIIKDFFGFIGNDIIVGHNVNFDINFLYDAGIKNSLILKNDYLDTLYIARRFLPDMPSRSLSFMLERYKIDVDNLHNAINDVKAEYELVNKLQEEFGNRFETELIKKPKKIFNLKEIKAEFSKEEIDKANPFYEKNIIFTGTLNNFTRKEAVQAAVNLGAVLASGVTKKVDYLIVGETDFKKVKEGMSSKMQKAIELQERGHKIKIITENTFIDMLEYEY